MDLAIARIVHVLAVILWIGGVGFVTTALIPSLRRTQAPERRLPTFLTFEGPFAAQARISVLLAGLSGLYMTWKLDAWGRFASARFWWMHAMVGVWLVFAVMLFVLEPFVLHRRLERELAAGAGPAVFDRMERFHRVMLVLSLLASLGAVGGAHGLFV
ncbi:MAG TPA: hypothetical protein VG939_03445 [Caulobacteraceae bacterium]|nr:hypothetical protein [Caulobacteraceae bacterium]